MWNDLVARLFVVRPHSQDTNNSLFAEDFVDHAVLDVNSTRIRPCQISDQLLVRRGGLKRVLCDDGKQFLGFLFESSGREFLRVLERVLCEDDFPTHHLSALALLAKGSAMPTLMDSRIPGTDSRYSVS